RYGSHPRANENLQSVQGSDRAVLFMLQSSPEGGWGLSAGPDPAGAGLRLVSPGEVGGLERDVLRIVASQAVDSLLARADLVVLGRESTFRPCMADSNLRCVAVAVDTVLAGSATDGEVLVFTP